MKKTPCSRCFPLLIGLAILAACSPLPFAEESSDANAFETRRYKIWPSYIGGPPPDPFADPPAPGSSSPQRMTAKEVFEKGYGIVFPEGASAHYNPGTSSLTIRHHEKGFEAIEKILEDLTANPDKQLNMRVEIYELPKQTALDLQEAKAAEPDHREQLEAIRDLVKSGTARLVTSIEVTARSGQRSKAESTRKVTAVSGYEWNEEAKAMLPQFEEIETGTTFEVDPVLGVDDKIIDLNFSLQLRAENPEPRLTQVVFPNETEVRELEFPVIHEAKIVTQITMKTGSAFFIGVFEPQPAQGENPDADSRWAAFLVPDVQIIGDDPLDFELISGKENNDDKTAP